MPKKLNKKKNVTIKVRAPPQKRLKGRGQYEVLEKMQNFGKQYVPEGAISAGLGALGGAFGPTGAVVGKAVGSLISKIVGFGQYKVQNNTLMNNDQIPQFTKDGDGLRVTHRECFGDLASSISYVNHTLGITPNNVLIFPWLSQLACYFQEFKFEGLVFEFKTTSSNALTSTNTALGTVIMSTNYDPDAEPFKSKIEMEAYEFTTSTCPAQSMLHGVECKPSSNVLSKLYTTGADVLSSTSDNRFTNLGTINIATVGMQANDAVIGELWVTYSIRLCKPKLVMDLSTTFFEAGTYDPADSVELTIDARGGVLSNEGTYYTITEGTTTRELGAVSRISIVNLDSMFIRAQGIYRVSVNCDVGAGGTLTSMYVPSSLGANLSLVSSAGIFNTASRTFPSAQLNLKQGTVGMGSYLIECSRNTFARFAGSGANYFELIKTITATASNCWFNLFVERVANPNGSGNNAIVTTTSINSLIRKLSSAIVSEQNDVDLRTAVTQLIRNPNPNPGLLSTDAINANRNTVRAYEDNYQQTLNRVDGLSSGRQRQTN